MKYRVTIDREKCIACGTCTVVCPDVFELGFDIGKSRVKEEYNVETDEKKSIGHVTVDLRDCARSAADACPVSAIKIEEISK